MLMARRVNTRTIPEKINGSPAPSIDIYAIKGNP
jgi:hypothetical protein